MTIRKLSHKTIALIILTFFIILSLFVGSTLAYVAIKKKADNVFSVGLVELTVEEDSFPKDEQNRWLVPKSFLPKNPHLVNTGTTDIYAFIEIVVPYEKVLFILDEGEYINTPDPSGEKEQELFNLYSEDENAFSGKETEGFTNSFSITETGEFTYHPNWIFISSKEDTQNKTHSYLFGYSAMLTAEEGHNATANLFDKIQLRNILEEAVSENATETIKVNAYGIQSEELKGDISVEDTENITKTELESLYRYYCNQEA